LSILAPDIGSADRSKEPIITPLTYETVAVEVDDRLAVVKITRPEVRNALNRQVVAELRDALTQLREARIQGTLCYTGDDYRAVIDLMARGHYDTTGWVEKIPMSGVIAEGFEALHAGQKMKVLVDPGA